MFRLRCTIGNLLWFAGYAGWLLAIVVGMRAASDSIVQELNTQAAQEQWQEWKSSVRDQQEQGPAARRLPKSDVPPMLILMRDYQGVLFAAAVTLGTVLYLVTMVFVRGAFQPSPPLPAVEDEPART